MQIRTTGDLVDWRCRHGGSQEIKFAAQRARTIYRDWLSRNKRKVEEQMRLFDLEGSNPLSYKYETTN